MYSLDAYEQILRAYLKQGFHFFPLGEAVSNSNPKVVLLRHDIDYSLEAAVKVAEVNHQLGVRACFCLQTRNALYNLLEERNSDRVHRIVALGHIIGLHFSFPMKAMDIPHDDLPEYVEKWIRQDLQLLESMLEQPVQSVMSWHNPSVLGREHARLVSRHVPGIVNAYALVADGLAYASDSNHRFTVAEWMNKARNSPARVHLLFHPFQWVHSSVRIEQVLGEAWKELIREMEWVFLTNHIYRERFPKGLSQSGLDAWVAPLLDVGDDGANPH